MDQKRAYYLFGTGDGGTQERLEGTITVWEALRHMAMKKGVEEMDLEGVNSPQRGWFKLGFGGDLRPYHEVVKRS